MRAAVVTFPGSNCDADSVHVLQNVLGVETSLVWHQETALPEGTGLVVLPGGFSYGDALRSGALARFSPIMESVKAHAETGGLVLGICNGFQILVESGLLPGAMLQNSSRKFVCKQAELEVCAEIPAFTSGYQTGQHITVPVAHHEGRYFADEATLKGLNDNGQVVFRYAAGTNPNGAVEDIAGLCNANKNVLGMMPHPERAAEAVVGGVDGLPLFKAAVAFLQNAEASA